MWKQAESGQNMGFELGKGGMKGLGSGANGLDRATNPQRIRKQVSIQQLLEWAFRVEKVSLDLPQAEEALIGRGYGTGSALRLIQRAELGCRIDGGGNSPCHEDAEAVAAVLSNLPIALGGRGMAVRMAEWARAGTTPDWMPGAAPKVVPALWHNNRHGRRAGSVKVGQIDVKVAETIVAYDLRACPITWSPSAHQIGVARREYLAWGLALLEVRSNLRACRMLRGHELTDAMPPRAPWEKSS